MSEPNFKVSINPEVLQREIIITNQEEFIQAGDVLKLCKDKIKEIDEERKSHTDPLEKEKKWWIAKAKEIIEPIEAYISKINKSMSDYHEANEAKRIAEEKKAEEERQAQLEKAQEEGRMPTREEILPKILETETTQKTSGNVATTSMVEKWEFEIIDEKQVPREFCIADERLIRQAVNGGLRELSGVRIYKKFIPKSFKN